MNDASHPVPETAARSLFERQRETLARLRELIIERAAAEAAVDAAYQQASEQAEREITRQRKQIAAGRKRETDEELARYEAIATEIVAKYEARQAAADRKRLEELQFSLGRYEEAHEKTKTAMKDRLWTIDSLFEAGDKEIEAEFVRSQRKWEANRRRAEATWAGVDPVLQRLGITRQQIAFQEANLPPATETDPEGYMIRKLEELDAAGERIEQAWLPKLLRPTGVLLILLAAGLLSSTAFALLPTAQAALAMAGSTLAIGGLLYLVIRWLAVSQGRRLGAAFGVFQAEASRAIRLFEEYAQRVRDRAKNDLTRQHANDRKRAHDHFQPILDKILKTKENEFEAIETEHDDKTVQIERDRLTETHAANSAHDAALTAIAAKYDDMARESEARYQASKQEAEARRDRDWQALASAWHTGIAAVHAECETWIDYARQRFPEWPLVQQGTEPLPAEVPDGILYGHLHVDMYALPDGEPLDQRLVPAQPVRMDVPAYLPFPDQASVLLKAADLGRPAAITAVQNLMLRYLTGLPPGKVRFTIIDPVGLGENFAAFMQLADYDEKLVGPRIWTEPRQIDQRLMDLTEHMENVIQKYLRNQYRSIEDYNRAAGEVAEPYRVLVVANFPVNFTPEAARRLVSILSSGPACGVCSLVTVDEQAPLPRDFRLADLEQVAFNLRWTDGRFAPSDSVLEVFPLRLENPPPSAATAAIIRRVGEASREAGRVEVPFDFIMPAPEKIWTGDSARGVEVPIGRAGATKRQVLALGRGTAQHALIAGKTGSGKSTLLHALITNLALHYGPDQVELYLIDFKKGVEFKLYASEALPHARVIAIESEREFGLSVLQRLDGILRERGELFRAVGANDLVGYRESTGKIMPRILLIVDEFQEFFVEDDKLSNEAALLLDRLVRQGRAFGLHILLGSQTLGGAYTLARSTIDQMAVRVALQCSDADAQLILSKDNTAARLLSRPGEAIYNDANGLVEGNNPFQVVWLAEDRRQRLLQDLRRRSATAYPPPLVFEGNQPALLAENPLLNAMLVRPPQQPRSFTAWLGEAIAIKDPTAAVFRPQSSANLLLIGQHEEAARAILTAVIVSLLPQLHERDRCWTILDGTPDDAEHADYYRRAAAALRIPQAVIERSALGEAITALHQELESRQQQASPDRTARFLLVHGLARFRELRKPEDDFGFGRKTDVPKPPGELFSNLLKDGPALGIYTLVWCDSLTNFNRSLERQALKEFGQRVLFQMSATDSSHLLDTPAASRLDQHRALFAIEEQTQPEKFRPYGLPDIDWLQSVGQQLR